MIVHRQLSGECAQGGSRSDARPIAAFREAPVPLLFIAICAAGSLTVADDAIDSLVRLVGPEAGLCVEIPRLEETVTAFERGEFFQRLQRSKIYADWQSGGEYRHARGIVTVIENFTGKSFRQFFHDMFGRAVVVAVYAETGREMSAIMLTETSSREALDAVIEGWNRAEPQQTDRDRIRRADLLQAHLLGKWGTGEAGPVLLQARPDADADRPGRMDPSLAHAGTIRRCERILVGASGVSGRTKIAAGTRSGAGLCESAGMGQRARFRARPDVGLIEPGGRLGGASASRCDDGRQSIPTQPVPRMPLRNRRL